MLIQKSGTEIQNCIKISQISSSEALLPGRNRKSSVTLNAVVANFKGFVFLLQVK